MEANEKIFEAFYDSKEQILYFSQLKLLTKLSNSSMQNALDNLRRKKLISVTKTKAHTFIELKDIDTTVREFIKFDIKKLNELNINVKIPLINFIQKSPDQIAFIILFGSASRKLERKDSDIDLIIVLYEFNNKELQKLYEKEITAQFEKIKKDASHLCIHPLSLVFITDKEFIDSDDHLISQARMTGFPIKGNAKYHELMINEYRKTSQRQKRIGKKIP